MAGNIGRARLKVLFLDKSPFGGQPRQEVAHYFSQDNIGPLKPAYVEALLAPINGIRNEESLQNYDNYLSDGDYYIEEATYTQSITTTSSGSSSGSSSSGTTTTVTTSEVDPAAVARIKQLQEGLANATPAQKAASAAEKSFFTWVVSSPIFTDAAYPEKFSNPPANDSAAPAWSLVAMPRPGPDTKTLMLTPFMRKSPPDETKPIHWGCKMKEAIAQNQPFEIIFYYCQRDPAVVRKGPKLTPRFVFRDRNGSPMDLALHNSVYIAVEFGISDPKHHFLMIFKSESEPMLFLVNGKDAKLEATFKDFNSSVVFDPSNKYFTVKIEPVAGSFIIRSNLFPAGPWVIHAPVEQPVFIGKGNIGIYSGNVQAGFAMRPVQYQQIGFFETPETQFTMIKQKSPNCTTALKGAGSVQQHMSYSGSGGAPEVHMVDAEKVNNSSANTFLEQYSGESGRDGGVNRKINLRTTQVANANPSSSSGEDLTQGGLATFKTSVEMHASDVYQGNGYVVKNGRSPYIWLVRCELPPMVGNAPQPELDISCDVMSVDLNFNATSYNELAHNGTLKVLNKVSRRQKGAVDYRSYLNRAVYVRIEAWWEIGVGHDPGPNNRNIFEGIAYGGTIDTKADNEIITFKLDDYMSALQGSKFILCPPYDGMAASLAVRDIVLQTGFPDNRILAGNTPISQANLKNDLGLGIARLFTQPSYRFPDGSSFKEAILKLAKVQFRTIYFDRFGNFHYEVMPGGLFVGQNAAPKIEFWSSAIEGDLFGLNDLKRIAWNMVSLTTLVNEVYNTIQVNTVDKFIPGLRLSAGQVYKAGIFDPKATGYLGYRKHLIINDPIYGSVQGVNNAVREYSSRFFLPPLSARFEIYGYTGLQPLDIIKLDGQLLRILNISTHLSAAENQYWQTIEGEWFFSTKDPGPQVQPPPNANNYASSSGSPGESSTY
jgi:hypothetical protein